MIYTCSLFGVIIVLAILYAIYTGIKFGIDTLRAPHKYVYHSQHPNATEATVQPLFAKDTTFDVVLTIWARLPDEDAEKRRTEKGVQKRDLKGIEGAVSKIAHKPYEELWWNPEEQAVFSEVVMENLGMGVRGRHVEVEFDLPLERL
jgi:hypothetical protein